MAPQDRDDPRRATGRPLWARLEALAMGAGLVASVAVAALAYDESLSTEDVFAGVRIEGIDAAGLDQAGVAVVAAGVVTAAMERPIALVGGEREVHSTARQLGARGDPAGLAARAQAVGRTGDVLQDLAARVRLATRGIDVTVSYDFDAGQALAHLESWVPRFDRPSLPSRLDLERRRWIPAVQGQSLLPADALSAVAIALETGARRVELPMQVKAAVAEDPLKELESLELGAVLGTFETPYSTAAKDQDRSFNLQVGARKLDGFVLMPGESFSFNAAVGPRDSKNGFRYGGGITAGEVVDVLGGGICQVSSTLHGAAFFAGLEITGYRPHSRPSSYVDMGLDSTVVWPDVDLQLRNPYDFPVVFHMIVSQGKAKAEILGARRVYQVAFERTIEDVIPHEVIWRNDNSLRAGSEVIAQHGMRGFKIRRVRKFYQAGEVVREDSQELLYPPTVEIRRRGTSPVGQVPEPQTSTVLRNPAPELRIVQ